VECEARADQLAALSYLSIKGASRMKITTDLATTFIQDAIAILANEKKEITVDAVWWWLVRDSGYEYPKGFIQQVIESRKEQAR
jgi:hypothetical protein